MSRIQKLSRELINIIAAGEVVERPASVVKELLENSIDAEATVIKLNIENYGKDLIEVVDNGIGMSQEDAMQSVEQHSTSKLKTKEDLEKIISFGFRGEALASISSVSGKTEIETKTDNTEPVKITIEDHKKKLETSTNMDRGTRIAIKSLFKNVPARQKFLKTDHTEFRNISNMFIEIALINTSIHFELTHNGKSIYKLPSTNTIKDRVFDIWGKQTAESFIDEQTFEYDNTKITLLLENPEKAKKTSSIQITYVNNRSIENKTILGAIREAYRGFIHKDLKTNHIIVIHIDPSTVDVNVHPRKLEVRFVEPQSIFRMTYSSAKKVLEQFTQRNLKSSIEVFKEAQIENLSLNNIENNKVIKQERSNIDFTTRQIPFKETTYEDSFKTIKTSNNKVNDAISFSKEILSNNFLEPSYIESNNISENVNYNPFQLFDTYIVYELNNELIFIDQHAAAEKIAFEKLLYSVGDVKTKPLLVPEIIELKSDEKSILLENKKDLSDIGIVIDDFGGNSIQVNEIPEILNNVNFEEYVNAIISNKEDFTWIKTQYSDIQVSNQIYDILALAACHGSIRAGQKLSGSEMKNILKNLYNLKQPNNCPHGRPTIWKLTKIEIEKNFKRIV